jgi:hypothetical protein
MIGTGVLDMTEAFGIESAGRRVDDRATPALSKTGANPLQGSRRLRQSEGGLLETRYPMCQRLPVHWRARDARLRHACRAPESCSDRQSECRRSERPLDWSRGPCTALRLDSRSPLWLETRPSLWMAPRSSPLAINRERGARPPGMRAIVRAPHLNDVLRSAGLPHPLDGRYATVGPRGAHARNRGLHRDRTTGERRPHLCRGQSGYERI